MKIQICHLASEELKLWVWKSLSKGKSLRSQGCVQVPVVVNISSTSAWTHPQLQTKQLELLSVASYTSLHPHGEEEKKKKSTQEIQHLCLFTGQIK